MIGSPNGRLSLLVVLGDNALFPMSRRLLGEQVGVSPEPPLGIFSLSLAGAAQK